MGPAGRACNADHGGDPHPCPVYLGFSGRTGGATNNHWVRGISFSKKPVRMIAASEFTASGPQPLFQAFAVAIMMVHY